MAVRFLTFLLMTLALFLLIWGVEIVCLHSGASANKAYMCQPTPEDELGPLYRAGAPMRNSVGAGYLLFGIVKSASDCEPISGAKIEIWLAGPQGVYGDQWRATLLSSENGAFHFTSHVPPDYGTGRAHLHLKVTADGYSDLITQHYPLKGAGEAIFDLVLEPQNQTSIR